MANRGVYFLANDRIFDLAVAFLNSFRAYNRSIPLCLIPFDGNTNAIESMAEVYNFTVYTNADVLRKCDEISRAFHGRVSGQYRKIAMWEGDFQEFVYIDTDTVVLESIEFVYDLLPRFGFITSHSHIPQSRKWVWKDSVQRSGKLTPDQIAYAANTGFIVSSTGSLSMDEARGKVSAARELAPHMELWCAEQPFLNYLMVTSGKPYSSLHRIRVESNLQDLPVERWAGRPVGLVRQGRIIYPTSPRVFLVHWAGEWQPARLDRMLSAAWLMLGLAPRLPGVRLFMRNKRLWRYYRNMRRHAGTVPVTFPESGSGPQCS